MKVVEKSGTTIKRGLVKSNPFKKNNCQREVCETCETHEINCKTREVVYRISCAGTTVDGHPCEGTFYEGETSRSVGERFSEHMKTIRSGNESTKKKSFLYDHVRNQHNDETPPVKLEVVAQCLGDPGFRQALEATRIREEKPSLNGKEEWTNQPRKRTENRTRR